MYQCRNVTWREWFCNLIYALSCKLKLLTMQWWADWRCCVPSCAHVISSISSFRFISTTCLCFVFCVFALCLVCMLASNLWFNRFCVCENKFNHSIGCYMESKYVFNFRRVWDIGFLICLFIFKVSFVVQSRLVFHWPCICWGSRDDQSKTVSWSDLMAAQDWITLKLTKVMMIQQCYRNLCERTVLIESSFVSSHLRRMSTFVYFTDEFSNVTNSCGQSVDVIHDNDQVWMRLRQWYWWWGTPR